MLKIFEVVLDTNVEEGAIVRFNHELLEVISEEKLNNLLDKEHEEKLIDVLNYIVDGIKKEF